MKKMIIRADDLGYCEAVNFGIAKTVKEGLVSSVGLMPNMSAAAHGVDLLKDTEVCIGQHSNICVGKPCAKPSMIPSLLQENGEFISSRTYREAFIRGKEITVFDEVVIEIEAQFNRFVQLTGREPEYFEGHAVQNQNLSKALELVANRHGLKYLQMAPSGSVGYYDGEPLYNCAIYSVRPGEYDPMQCLKDAVTKAHEDIANVFICHPGYVDEYLLQTSSLTLNRVKEVELLCNPDVHAWLEKQGIQLISYRDIWKEKD